MSTKRNIISDIIIGAILSSIFCGLLVKQIMAGGVGDSISFREFLSYPENILFCLVMSMFIFASWLMRGINNRAVLFCWAIMYTVHFFIFSNVYDYFYYDNINIYMLLLSGVSATLPSLIVIRYRVFVTTFLLVIVARAGLFNKQIGYYLRHASGTDFEVNMKMALYTAFSVEFLYSLYMVVYGVLNGIPYFGSITSHLEQNSAWDPYWLYHVLLNLVTVLYILLIGFYIYRDNTNPDAYMHGFSYEERRQASLQVLEKYRKLAEQKQKNKRD